MVLHLSKHEKSKYTAVYTVYSISGRIVEFVNLLFCYFTHDNIVILEDWTSKCSASLTEIQSQIVSAQIKKTQRVTQNQQTETEVPHVFLAVGINETFTLLTCCSCHPFFHQVPVRICRQELYPMKQKSIAIKCVARVYFRYLGCPQ